MLEKKYEMHGSYRYCLAVGCEFYTPSPSTFSMHYKKNHTSANIECVVCFEMFHANDMKHHMVNQHSEPGIPCREKSCDMVFKNETTHKTHYVRAHMTKSSLYRKLANLDCKCLSCDKMHTENAIIYHVSVCSPQSPFSAKFGGGMLTGLDDLPDDFLVQDASTDASAGWASGAELEDLPEDMDLACEEEEDFDDLPDNIAELLEFL